MDTANTDKYRNVEAELKARGVVIKQDAKPHDGYTKPLHTKRVHSWSPARVRVS